MSITIDPVIDQSSSRPHPYPYLRPIVLTLLLAAEALFFTIRFEAPQGLPSGPWWSWVLRNSHSIARMILLGSVAIGTFGGLRFAVRLRRAFLLGAGSDATWPHWFFLHGLALVGFARLTLFVCEGDLAGSAHPGAWAFAWVASGLATGASWLATILPPSSWPGILDRGKVSIAAGLAVAGAAFLLGDYTSRLWESMAWATLGLVRAMLGLVSGQVACDPTRLTVGVGGFQVRVAPACSGFEGIGLVLAFLSAYLWCFRRSLRWPRAYLLLPLGAVVIWLLNAARIATLVLIGAWASPGIALGGFHSQAGWMAFLGVSLGLVAASRRSSFFANDVRDLGGRALANPSASFLGPFLAILATSMVTGALSTGFDPFYGLRVLTGGLALWYFRRDFAGLLRGWSWAGVAVGVVAFALWVALEPASTEASRSLASQAWGLPPGGAWAWIVLRVVGSVAIVPLAEELAFRGYLTRRLVSVDFESVPLGRLSWPSLLISSAAFGLLHGRWLAGMLVGVLYALALLRRGKLGDAVLAHAVTNALIAATVLATGDWGLWS